MLKSNVCLEIRENTRLLGSTDLTDYPDYVPSGHTVMDTHMYITQSLIYADKCENISICGKGTIDGQGTVGNFPVDETVCETPGRPFLMRIIDCCGVHITNVTITNPACWTQNYLNCENVILENLHVESQSNYNNDGIDIDSCRNVIVRDYIAKLNDDMISLAEEPRSILIDGRSGTG